MRFTDSYIDLCGEIEMLEIRIKDMEQEREFLRKRMYDNAPTFRATASYGTERVQNGYAPMSLDRILERLNKIDDSLNTMHEVLRAKKDARSKMERVLGNFDGLEYKVAYMRDIKRMKLHEIADELGYSHDWIRKISSRVRKAQIRHKNLG
jgi:DNA-directed RNA polymerase specialized sigma24 family protein